MSYTKQNFEDGMTLNASHLNHIEDGIEAAMLMGEGFAPIICTASGKFVSIKDSAAKPIRALTIYGKGEQGGTPSPENPIPIEGAGENGSLTVTIAGKNLWDIESMIAEISDISYDPITGFYVGLRKYWTNYGAIRYFKENEIGKPITISATCKLDTGCTSFTFVTKINGNVQHPATIRPGDGEKFISFTVIPVSTDDSLYFTYGDGDSIVYVKEPQIEAGSTATAYEPYRTTTANLTTGLPLYAAPVSSGGNVTIDGQQYIADMLEVNADGSGKIERFVCAYRFSGNENFAKNTSEIYPELVSYYTNDVPGYTVNFGGNILSNRFTNIGSWKLNSIHGKNDINFYVSATEFPDVVSFKSFLANNEVVIIYQLAVPIEIPLTAGEVAALESLETYKPVTNISNDAGAYMEVEYVADTKAYIDNKFAELATAIVNNA